jgi:hypothetical protein
MTIDYDRAFITVNLSDDSLDPEGLATSDELDACGDYILDCVRSAFPGAEVCVGSDCSGVTRDGVEFDREVWLEVNRAFDSFSW